MPDRSAPPRQRYVEGEEPGYTRRHRGKGWQYLTSMGRAVRSAAVIARLNALALPPAYRDAWYALDADAHGRTRLKPLLDEVAGQLVNTPAVARKSYVHPQVIEAVLDPPQRDWRLPRATRWLTRGERGLLALLAEPDRARGP